LWQLAVKPTDLQILGCELHKNAFCGRALPGPAGGAIALPRPPSRYKGREGIREKKGLTGRGRNGRVEGRERLGRHRKGRKGAEGGQRVGKGEGKLDLDVCPGPPSS